MTFIEAEALEQGAPIVDHFGNRGIALGVTKQGLVVRMHGSKVEETVDPSRVEKVKARR